MLTIVPEAVEAPGACAISKSTTGPFVDTNVVIPFHGRLYLSVPYLNSIAADLGWVPAPELAKALEDLDDSYTAVGLLSKRVETFDESMESVAAALKNFTDEFIASRDVAGDLADALVKVDELNAWITKLEGAE